MVEIVLALIPLLLLVASLLLGVYPGCEAIVRLSARIASRSRPRAASSRSRRPLPPRLHAVSGGLLIAFGLARRPPPLAP